MLLALAVGLAFWIIYGAMSRSLPLIETNGVVLLLILLLIAMKLILLPQKITIRPRDDHRFDMAKAAAWFVRIWK